MIGNQITCWMPSMVSE